jgi:hypothetical protein
MPFTAMDLDQRWLCDIGGRTVGQVTAIYEYPADLDAPWGAAAVTRGSVFRKTHLVDLYDASFDQDRVVVAYPLEKIKEAPDYYAMIVGDTLSEDQAAHLLAHYRGTPQLV